MSLLLLLSCVVVLLWPFLLQQLLPFVQLFLLPLRCSEKEFSSHVGSGVSMYMHFVKCTGWLFVLNQATISWGSKKQASVALSSCEAEIMP